MDKAVEMLEKKAKSDRLKRYFKIEDEYNQLVMAEESDGFGRVYVVTGPFWIVAEVYQSIIRSFHPAGYGTRVESIKVAEELPWPAGRPDRLTIRVHRWNSSD